MWGCRRRNDSEDSRGVALRNCYSDHREGSIQSWGCQPKIKHCLKRPEILGGVYVFWGCAASAVILGAVCSGVYTGLFNPMP